MTDRRQQDLLKIVAAVSFLLAVVNNLLPPKAYSATQLLYDYSLGPIRRGLVGELLGVFTGPHVSVGEIHAAAALVTIIGATGFYLFLRRWLASGRAQILLLILALNSFAFASLVGNTGYLDAILLALVVVALALDPRRRLSVALKVVSALIGVLVHENMLPYFSMLLAFDLYLTRPGTGRALVRASLPVIAGAGMVAALFLSTHTTAEQAQALVTHLQDKAEFRIATDAAIVSASGFARNLTYMEQQHGTLHYWVWVLFDGLPLALMSLWLIWLGLRLLGRQATTMTRLLLVGAIIAPLSLNLVAFDVVRFGVASVLAGFLAVALVLRHTDGAPQRLDQILTWPHFLLVLVLNVNISTMQINEASGHMAQFPWVLLNQLKWFAP